MWLILLLPASAQTRVLFCHDCVDCPRVEANTPRTDCYGPVSDPTRVTDSVTGKTKIVEIVKNFVQTFSSQLAWHHRHQQFRLLPQHQTSNQRFKIKKILHNLLTLTFPLSKQLLAFNATRFVQEVRQWHFSFYFSPLQWIFSVGDRSIMSRGCALISHTKEATCLQHNQGEEPDFCDLCDEDDCNTVAGVGKMFASMTIIFATLFISLRLY